MCGTGTRTDRSELTRAWKTRVASSFDQAASKYEQRADVQRRVADRLSAWILERMESVGDALEIGCGTGFLTRALVRGLPNTAWTITDLAPRMLEQCRKSLSLEAAGSERRFEVLDGEAPGSLAGNFDLICSNLTFQWFTDLERGIAGLMQCVRPGGWLCFTTLGNETFSNVARQFPEWKFPDRFAAWPNPLQITEMITSNAQWHSEIHSEIFSEQFDNLGNFLHSLKSIGAATAWQPGSNPSRLRNAIRQSRANNQLVDADYQVLFVAIQKPAIHD